MARTERKVETLVADDAAMEDAIEAVLAVADDQGTVSWADVSDDLSTGQWGRLIEEGVLVDADGEGFAVEDPEGIREALSADHDAGPDDDEGVSWSVYDKGAALASVVLFLGYSMGEVRSLVGESIDLLLGPLRAALPFYVVIIVLALVTGLYSTILQDKLMDTELMGKYQEQMQDLQERRKEAKERGDDEALERIQQEQMEAFGDQMGMFKAQFRPMVWIMLFTIPAFLWMYWLIRDGHLSTEGVAMVMPLLGEVQTWQAGILGPIQAWILWYFLCSLGFTQLMRKALDVDTTPT